MQKPAISVIIPAYNAEKFIRRCVDSVLKQSLQDFEIIIVDDGSQDSTKTICEQLTLKNDKIKFFHKENGGANSTRKFGVEHSNGHYINFVDSDDTIPNNSLVQLYQTAIENKLDIIQAARRFYPNGSSTYQLSTFVKPGIYNNLEFIHLLFQNKSNAGPVGSLYKRDLFGEETFDIPKDVKLGEDFYMNLCLGVRANKVGLFNNIEAYNYFENTNSVTHVYRYTSISPQQEQLESIRRELINNHLFDEFSDDFYRRALGVLSSACFHNHQLIHSQYIKQMAQEIWPKLHYRKEKCLCYMLLHPSILPIMNTINESRKIVSNIRKRLQ